MAPPTAVSSDTPSDTPSSPAIPAGIQIALAVIFPLAVLSLLVLEAVMFYRRRAQRLKTTGGQSVLSVGVTVDVDKIVDLPYESKDQACRDADSRPARRSTVAYAGTISSLDTHSKCSSLGFGALTDGSSMTSSPSPSKSPTPHLDLPADRPRPTKRVPLGSYFKTYPSSTSMAHRSCLFPLGAAFPSLDAEGLTQSTVRFPRLPPTLDDDHPNLSGYPTIPSIHSTPFVPTRLQKYNLTNPDDPNANCTEPNAGHDIEDPASDDSLNTLVDSSACPQLLAEPAYMDASGESQSPEKSSLVLSLDPRVSLLDRGDRSSTPNTAEVKPTELSPDIRRPVSSFSLIASMSLSPLQANLSPVASIVTLALESESRGDDIPSLQTTPDLGSFAVSATPLLEESLPGTPQTVLSIATCKQPTLTKSPSIAENPGAVGRKHPGRVLQPLFESSVSSDCSKVNLAHLSMASLRSAFTLSRSPPLRFSLGSPPALPRSTSTMRSSLHLDTEFPDTPLPKLALSSPLASFHVSLSPSASVDITAAYSPSLIGSPFQRPRAPTPGSVASRLSALAHFREEDHYPHEQRNDLLAPMACDRPSYRLPASFSVDTFSSSPTSPFCRPRAPTPGSVASLSPQPDEDVTGTPQLLPPLNLEAISPLLI